MNYTDFDKPITDDGFLELMQLFLDDEEEPLIPKKAWDEIEAEFNASSTCTTYRNALSLKKWYENRKKELRKTLATNKREALLTGGGPPPKKKKDGDDTLMDDILMAILNEKTLLGLKNPFDDDADETEIPHIEGNEEVVLELEAYPCEVATTENCVADTVNVEAQSSINAIQMPVPTMNWKKYVPKQLQCPTSAILRFSEEKENIPEPDNAPAPNKVNTPKNANRRRPTTVVKTLTSSEIAKKYNLLLDKRLSLVDAQIKHLHAENELVLKKRELEIELLHIQIANEKYVE
ncbi:uncharacterized protein LOC116164006 [Photinus pyralis]|uniref:uncharacterized protein LOC116164006 n=1 Tax=Photinus pyralis TaxID=7054 RepID=UPI00126745FA|nr:uncharacterized protein LOC116164006 [Photinus pyralis]